MKLLCRLWQDDAGFTISGPFILWTTIFVIGAIAGLTTYRDQLVQQFGDAAVALESLDQSYSFSVGTVSSLYNDPPNLLDDPDGAEPACIEINDIAASVEGS